MGFSFVASRKDAKAPSKTMTQVPDTPFLLEVKLTGKLPPYGSVADALWGVGCDFKSDGNASHRTDQNWTELTMILRPDWSERIDIDPSPEIPKNIVIHASSEALLEKVYQYLLECNSIQPIA